MKRSQLSSLFLSFSLGLIYAWFGGLKLIGLSEARELVTQTVPFLPESVVLLGLGAWEVAMGIGLLIPIPGWRARVLPLVFLHLFATTMPLVFLPKLCFIRFPWVPSLVGQYIMKNLILFSAAYTLYERGNIRFRFPVRRALKYLAAASLVACIVFPMGRGVAQADDTALAAYFPQPVRLPSSPLSELDKARHVLDRLAFGPRRGEAERLARGGDEAIAAWITQQLFPATISDEKVERAFARFAIESHTAKDLRRDYPQPNELAKQIGIDPKDLKDPKELIRRLGKDRLPQHILEEMTAQKLLRGAESERQLEEVLTDFWFNHFNVDFRKDKVRWLLPSYEKEAIRPHVFGRFRDLLGAVAHHPAMLVYLDNALSVKDGFVPPRRKDGERAEVRGLNENYGRELLELHTLGVDGGYSQHDVREVARAFTGWSLTGGDKGFHFVFRDDAHDDGEKKVLGMTIPAGGGVEDGERVLDRVAAHPSTARFVALKLCRRFVGDNPPSRLVDRVAGTFTASGGDLRWVYLSLFTSSEFWSKEAFRAKVKTPFEYVVSAVRAVGARVIETEALGRRVAQMGEQLYQCVPPTGYKEIAEPWVSSGALVSRLNFSMALSNNHLPGVEVDLEHSGERPRQVALYLGSPEFQRR